MDEKGSLTKHLQGRTCLPLMVSAERDRHSVMETPSLERYRVFWEMGMAAAVSWDKYLPAEQKIYFDE